MFITHTDARRFFEQRIVAQADAEDTPLSPDEQLMLKWSESEPDSVADPALAARLASIIFDDEYEQKIGKLLERSYAADLARDRTAKKKWRRPSVSEAGRLLPRRGGRARPGSSAGAVWNCGGSPGRLGAHRFVLSATRDDRVLSGCWPALQCTADILRLRTEREQSLDEQIHRDGLVASLHLRHA